jgi:hypothetical protein
MRLLLLAGVLCASLMIPFASSFSEEIPTWTYHECVQDCRDNAPETMTLRQCINEKNCEQYPKPERTYDDCVMYCQAQISLTGQPLQQCIARYVCGQYPRK